ncbi:MAG: SH3 domain-containing protein [Agathobaculum sp.]|uniref:SH3 domain-containing protein n=1 Tax=Agathobaculum sp. TaxID=2048138 RepID=UPI003D8D354C
MMKDKKYFTGSYKRAAAAALTSALLLTPLASLAESAMIQGGVLNLREQPSKNATVLGQYPSGTWVEVLEAGIDWSRVSVDGKEGYMMSKYLTGGSSGSSSTMYVRTNTRGLNLRKEPNDTSAIITSYPKGTKVTVLARGTKWHKVSVGGNVGYMYAQYLSSSPAGGGDSGSGISGQTGVVNNPRDTQVLFLRESASTSSKVLGQYRNGKKVKILSSANGWYKVEVDGKTGYMMARYVKVASSSTSARLMNPNGNSIVNFRSGPSLSAKVIDVYKVGTAVTVLEKGTDWCKVQIGDAVGYVSTWFIKF